MNIVSHCRWLRTEEPSWWATTAIILAILIGRIMIALTIMSKVLDKLSSEGIALPGGSILKSSIPFLAFSSALSYPILWILLCAFLAASSQLFHGGIAFDLLLRASSKAFLTQIPVLLISLGISHSLDIPRIPEGIPDASEIGQYIADLAQNVSQSSNLVFLRVINFIFDLILMLAVSSVYCDLVHCSKWHSIWLGFALCALFLFPKSII